MKLPLNALQVERFLFERHKRDTIFFPCNIGPLPQEVYLKIGSVVPPEWRNVQKDNFTDLKKLFEFLHLDFEVYQHLVIQSSRFPLNLPRRLAEKIEKRVWNDPILRQFLPLKEERTPNPLFLLDPLSDLSFRKKPKLLHKYKGRALLLCTSACAMHCRYCFRQHFDYEVSDKLFEEELNLIAQEPSISEVLLSGGDPLSLSTPHLSHVIDSLSAISHVKRIRFHTRFPMGIPERIDSEFLELLKKCSKQIIFVLHCNHPKEFDGEIFSSLRKIQDLRIPILTQSVLLRGINDQLETLKTLFELLINHGIIPYYLHQLDRVQGATHFEVSEEEGKILMKQLAVELPGYALPRYVREVPNKPHKSHLV